MKNKSDLNDIGFIESIGSHVETLNEELVDIQYNFVLKKLEIFMCSIMDAVLNNSDLYKILEKENYLEIFPFKDDGLILKIIDFYMNDYNFESTNLDNNFTRYTFEYLIEDSNYTLNDGDKCILLKGRFDCILSVDFRDSKDKELYVEDYNNSEEFINDLQDGDHFIVSAESNNMVFFNQYIDGTKDIDILDQEVTIKRVALLLDILGRLKEDYVDNIKDFEL